MDTRVASRRRNVRVGLTLLLLNTVGTLAAGRLSATSLIPISDRELHARADVVVHGVVVSSLTIEDSLGRPETVTVIEPLEVLKGRVPGTLTLRQLGGELPDGRFLKLWGRPEYQAGHEVVVFAIARPEGDYQTAELLLGKFEVALDERGIAFAVPSLATQAADVTVVRRAGKNAWEDGDSGIAADSAAPRELGAFLRSLQKPASPAAAEAASPSGRLQPILHPEYATPDARPLWGNINNSFWRWNNGAAAVWTLDGQANIDGGGAAEAANATAAWDDEPNSTIGYTIGTGSSNFIHLDALSSPCGWTTCMSGGGVIGCGGPNGVGGSNSWRGETYSTITSGTVWLRSYCSHNLWSSVITQAVLTHELGHTMGLGHSDQNVSTHDTCRGDEDAAQMRSYVQSSTALGTDDSDAVRWLYGDGGNSCGGTSPTLTVTKTGTGSGTVTSSPSGISCGATCSSTFATGSVVSLSAAASSGSVFTGWGGDADCSDGSVTMSAAVNCSANFGLLADLVVSPLTGPATGTAGAAISISETTKNQGGATAAASTTRYYLSTHSTPGSGDVLLGSRSVDPLSAGVSSPATVPLTIPAGTASGNYYILARADADSQVSESVESNNSAAAAIKISSPDLVVSSLSVPSSSGAGMTVTVTDTTKNSGGAATSVNSSTGFYLSVNNTWSAGDVLLGSRSVGILAPNGTSVATTTLTIPQSTAPGSYFILAMADDGNAVAESSETNNTKSAQIRLSPDLQVSSLSVPTKAAAGATISATDTTKNQGQGTAGATTTRFYLSPTTTFNSATATEVGSRAVALLASGASSSASSALTIPAGTAPGSYYMLARADADGAVTETNETNNVASKALTVSP